MGDLLFGRTAGARRWRGADPVDPESRRPCDGACSAGLERRGAATAWWRVSCLGVLTVVPDRLAADRSEPVDQAPTVTLR
jgi:hypothetical protein